MGFFRALDYLVSKALFLGVLPLQLVLDDGVVEVNRQFVITGLGEEAALNFFDQTCEVLLTLGIDQLSLFVQFFT